MNESCAKMREGLQIFFYDSTTEKGPVKNEGSTIFHQDYCIKTIRPALVIIMSIELILFLIITARNNGYVQFTLFLVMRHHHCHKSWLAKFKTCTLNSFQKILYIQTLRSSKPIYMRPDPSLPSSSSLYSCKK